MQDEVSPEMLQPDEEEVQLQETEKVPMPYVGFISTVIFSIALYFLLRAIPHSQLSLFPYDTVSSEAPTSLYYRFIWFIEDFTNAQFYASVLAGIGLIVGAFIAYGLNSRRSKAGGFTISYIMRLFPWVFAAQMLGLIVSVFAPGYVHLLETMDMGWVPTFIPFVSTPVIVVLIYGPTIQAVLTGGILSGLISTPIAAFIIKFILDPFGLPAVSANVFTMALVGIIVLEVCRYVPWMKPLEEDFYIQPKLFHRRYGEMAPETKGYGTVWFFRRVLADFTEAQFYGNEWASGLMLAGLIIHYILDPSGVYYGNDYVPILLSASILSSAIGVFLYHNHWRTLGFYPTFTPVVTVVPGIVLIVEGDVFLSVVAAVLGGILTPPFADLINRNIPKGWHPMIGNTFSMAVCTAIIALIVKALPVIGIGY